MVRNGTAQAAADLADATECGAAALHDQSSIVGVGSVFRSEVRSERRDLTSAVCYRAGADGPLGRRSGFWYVRCVSSCQRLSAVCAA